MIDEIVIHNFIKKIEETPLHEEQLLLVVKGVIELFPISDAYLFRYSPFGFLAEGLIKIDSKGLTSIRDIRDDVRSIPGVISAIRKRKAEFVCDEGVFTQSFQYVNLPSIVSYLVVPICFSGIVIGYTTSSNFTAPFKNDKKLLHSLTEYGKSVGRIFESATFPMNTNKLSKRETEVMQRLAWGESVKEMANSLNISEFTIKDYVKSVMRKLGTQNRVQAVADLLRRGIIS